MSILDNLWRGIYQFGFPAALNRVTGCPEHLTVDVSSADYAVPAEWQNCKGISCDVSGLIKVDKINPANGASYQETLQVEPGTVYPISFVTKVYRYRTGTTACTAQVYKDDGSAAVVGIKLRR